MTKYQEKAIETLKNAFFKYYSYGRPETREFKEIHVEEWDETGTVYVRLEVGQIGDEGTLAECFCRDTTAVCVGKRGGYFSYREFSNKKCTLNLLEAITWGFHCRQLREKRLKKEEA